MTPEYQSHQHSLEVLNLLAEHHDFMESIKTIADMGAGVGADANWWATRASEDDQGQSRPLNIKVHAVDLDSANKNATHKNVKWHSADFSRTNLAKNSIDLIWSHDSFQYSQNPIETLHHWYDIMKQDAMLCLVVPFNFDLYFFKNQPRIIAKVEPGRYFNYTPANLILLLASAGFDCRAGHFKYEPNNPWFYAAVYKSNQKPQKYINWYDLLDTKLLPLSFEKPIMSKGYVSDTDLIVEWIDHSIYNLALQ